MGRKSSCEPRAPTAQFSSLSLIAANLQGWDNARTDGQTPCPTPLEDGRFEAERSRSRGDLGKMIFFSPSPNQVMEKPAPSGSTRSISAKHLVRSPSPNERRDKLQNQWSLGEP